MILRENFHVLTGGPGVGKTAVLRELERGGELVVEENARAVIRDQVAQGGLGLPWGDNDRFVLLTMERDLAAFDARLDETRRVFFDRGLFDMYGTNGTTPPPSLIEAVRTLRYNRRVFVFPPWREVYRTDAERRQDWAEAERTHERVRATLSALNYEAVDVPTGTVEARADFILTNL